VIFLRKAIDYQEKTRPTERTADQSLAIRPPAVKSLTQLRDQGDKAIL